VISLWAAKAAPQRSGPARWSPGRAVKRDDEGHDRSFDQIVSSWAEMFFGGFRLRLAGRWCHIWS
jgi:hypothetical protein